MKDFLTTTIMQAGTLAKGYFDKGVTHREKSHLADIVTDADLAVSNFLVSAIHKEFPDHQIHSEEMKEDVNPGARYEWVLDPIDGTRNFAFGIPLWCTLIAVLENREPYLGAVYSPISNELFFAEAGHGATLNSMPIRVNSIDSFDHAYGYFSRAGNGTVYGTHGDRYQRAHTRLVQETTAWIHCFGTMLGTCYIASGGVDFMAQNAGLDHDYLAPALICREAGAIVSDSDGNPWTRHRQDIIIANPKMHKKVLALFE